MGLFYTTHTVLGADAEQIKAALLNMKRTAFISPTVKEYTVVYDRISEENSDDIDIVGMGLSKECSAPVLAASLHDDSVLYLSLFQDGFRRDFYNSLPGYFEEGGENNTPVGGNSEMLCLVFGHMRSTEKVERFLRANLIDDENPPVPGELERHQAIIKELGMPAFSAEVTFSSINGKYVSDDFKEINFTAVNSK